MIKYIIIITSALMLLASHASAEYFKQRNIIRECAKDTSFGSTCYTYLAAYSDFLGFFARATDAQRAKSVCILSLENQISSKQ